MGYKVTKKYRSKYETYKPKEATKEFSTRAEAQREAKRIDRQSKEPAYKHVKFWKATITKTRGTSW